MLRDLPGAPAAIRTPFVFRIEAAYTGNLAVTVGGIGTVTRAAASSQYLFAFFLLQFLHVFIRNSVHLSPILWQVLPTISVYGLQHGNPWGKTDCFRFFQF